MKVLNPSYALLFLTIMLLSGCGGGGGGGEATGGGGDVDVTAADITLSGAGVKGPLIKAQVAVYNFDSNKASFHAGTPISTGTTNEAAEIVGISLPANKKVILPLIVELTSDANTVDLTTGQAPVLKTLRTVITDARWSEIEQGDAVYATPLTTMAVDLAIALSGPAASADTFAANLTKAEGMVVASFGFGLLDNVDIFRTSPVLTDEAVGLDAQLLVAEYRTAIEAAAAIVVELRDTILNSDPSSKVTNEDVLMALAQDLADGSLDGMSQGEPLEELVDVSNVAAIVSQDPTALVVPGTTISLNDIELILVGEASVTCHCGNLVIMSDDIDVVPQPVETIITESAPVKAPNASLLPRVISVESISLHYINVAFESIASVSAAKNTLNYTVSLKDNHHPLSILSAVMAADNKSVMLKIEPDLADAPLSGGRSLEFDLVDVDDEIIEFDLNGNSEPVLLSAGSISDTRVLLQFSESMSNLADAPANYQLSKNSNGDALTVTKAVRSDENMSVILTTAPQLDTVYRVVASGLTGQATGAPIDTLENERTFLGASEQTGIASKPVMVSAISQGNKTVVVTYSKPMEDGADNALNYAIVQDNVNPESGSLGVVSARFVGADRTAVELTTNSQNEVSYTVTATNAKDSYGQQLNVTTTATGITTGNNASFAGTPPGGDEFVDSDGDGIFDNEEQRGWSVSIKLVDGTVITREVTSSVLYEDTDNDGLSDQEELALHTDPRDMDTDDDMLPDAYEINAVFSDPLDQDTDGDVLSDWLEVYFFKTSPLLTDTDGDQISDDDEIVLANRDPLIADLPQPAFDVESITLELDVRFDETNETGTTQLEAKDVSTTLTQSETKSFANTDEFSTKAIAEVSASTEVEIGGSVTEGPSAATVVAVSATGSLEAGYTGSWSNESVAATQNEYNKSLTTSEEVSQGSTVSRRVEAATVSTLLTLKANGDIAFTISDLQITALVPDIKNPGKFLSVATLVPENPDGDLENRFNLGPLIDHIGPLRFVNTSIYPAQVERLMRDPTGVIFKISNYNITDEAGRNFAYTSQDIIDRTTALTIDFGSADLDGDGIGDTTERYRVATSFGVSIASVIEEIAAEEGITQEKVRTLYGLSADDNESIIAFDLSGKYLGVVFHDVMQNVLGLKHYDSDMDTTDESERYASYATTFSNGVERLTRVRQVEDDDKTAWAVMTPTGLIMDSYLSFGGGDIKADDQAMLPGSGQTFAYVQDKDQDYLPARLESLHGCSDENADTDGDGLTDYLEVFGAPKNADGSYKDINDVWTIDAGAGTYEGFASCASNDTDQDGLSDSAEYALRTDAKKQDTDDDGINDDDEVNGYSVYLEFSYIPGDSVAGYSCEDTNVTSADGKFVITCWSDPLNPDTDADGLPDGAESAFYANPTVFDAGDVSDIDSDGLLGREEKDGWDVTWTDIDGATKNCYKPSDINVNCDAIYGGVDNTQPTSNPLVVDTDGDSLSDYDEFINKTHPRIDDTDKDGRTDFDEVRGDTTSDPLKTDTDSDGLSDGDELTVHWTVNGAQTTATDPNNRDSDFDGLEDGDEQVRLTDPNLYNTDDDDYGLSDGQEIAMGLNPLDRTDICVKVTPVGMGLVKSAAKNGETEFVKTTFELEKYVNAETSFVDTYAPEFCINFGVTTCNTYFPVPFTLSTATLTNQPEGAYVHLSSTRSAFVSNSDTWFIDYADSIYVMNEGSKEITTADFSNGAPTATITYNISGTLAVTADTIEIQPQWHAQVVRATDSQSDIDACASVQ